MHLKKQSLSKKSNEYLGWFGKIRQFTGKEFLALSITTGGPPLTRKSLTQFPLPWFLAYVRASGGFYR